MSLDFTEVVSLTFNCNDVIEGIELFERVPLVCNISGEKRHVEVPIIKMPILRDRVKPYLKELGLITPTITINSVLGIKLRKKLKGQIQQLISMINENINDSDNLKEVVLKFLEIPGYFEKVPVERLNLSSDRQSPRLSVNRSNKLITMIPREDSDDIRTILTNDQQINFEDLILIREAGKGAFGRIYKARHRGTYVAVKQFCVSEISNDLIKEMRYEVSVLSSLRHPNIVLYIGASLLPPNIGVVTEWCENGSLADFLHDFKQPLFGKQLLQYALEISQGMEYLQGHRNRIIHRDLKSDNVLLGRHFEAKVADFGLTVVTE